jgi:hypothetical protein
VSRHRRTITALAIFTLLGGGAAAAQQPPADSGHGGVPILRDVWRTVSDSSHAGWARPLASALIPGMGQLLGHRERGALYLAAEAFLLTRVLTLNAEGRRERERYHELAWVVARGAYSPSAPDTVFEYFEQMGRYVESGPFDADPGPGFAPPTDERTYNGQIWALARRTFFADPDQPPPPDSPEYQRALAFYSSRAIGPAFQWSWRNAGLEQDLYRQTIHQSDDAFRSATQHLGLLLANHALSAVDAFVSERLSLGGHPIALHTGVGPDPMRARALAFTAQVRMGF